MEKTDYKNVFVFAEQRDGVIQSVALELLGKAHELAGVLNEKVVAVLPGHNITKHAQMLIEYGADEVICIDEPELKDYLTEQYAQTICQVVNKFKPSILMIGATTIGRDLGPRLAARLTTGLTADCTRLEISEEGELMMTRPAFGGNLMATIMCTEHRPQMSTVRPGVMQKMTRDANRKGNVITFKPEFDKSKFLVRMVENVKVDKGKVDITDAKVLVQSVKTQNALRTQRALELNAAGDYEAAGALLRMNNDAGVQVLRDYDASFVGDRSAAEELNEENDWNRSNASSLGGSLGAERRKKFKTRSSQIENQQSVKQEGL